MPAPEIGLNGLLLDYPYSGSATYARNLARHLPLVASDLRFRLYVRDAEIEVDGVTVHELQTPFAPFNNRPVAGRVDKLVWEMGMWPVASLIRSDSVMHSLYLSAPVWAPAPVVVTIHDLIPLVMPGYHRSRQSVLYTRAMARTVKRAAVIITVSEHSKRDIIRVLGVPPERVRVTYEAVDERFQPDGAEGERELLQARYGVPDRYLLYTGGAERRKNIETLVRACARIKGVLRRHEVKLLVVAKFPPPDRLYPDIPGLVREMDLAGNVVFLSSVDEDAKPALYRQALAFCFASCYEGFGFTPLEAMACGAPVITARATSIPEVVGEAAQLLPPDDVEAWANAISGLIDSGAERERLARAGPERASRFSWRSTADQTAAVYREML